MVSQKDTTFTKIFVGGLPYHTTDETLRKFFERFGDIEEAVVITDRATGKSRGYGFVTMATKEGAQEAIKDPNPVIDGRKANVNLAYLGAKPRTLNNTTATNAVFHLGAAYPTIPAYGLQPIIYPTHTLLGSNGLIPAYTGGGTTLSQSAAAAAAAQSAHYTTAYDLGQFGTTATQLDLSNAASFPYNTNTLNSINAALALNNQLAAAAAASNNPLAATNASQQLANANSYYAALASAQAITATGAPSLAAAYQQ